MTSPRLLYVATGNPHKVEEIQAILGPLGFEVRRPDGLEDVDETGATFRDNAILKAAAAARALGAAVLADDSGLAVDVLDGAPGVRSARYAGPDATDADNNRKLVETLEARETVDPEAAFVCYVVVVSPDGTVIAEAEGRVEGVIRWPARGDGGFGYDPLFHHPASGCRMAELSPEQKNALSHRGNALRLLAERLGG